MTQPGLSAGEVARRLGVAVTTVRTWDRRYGLGPSERDPGRHRRYSPADLTRLELMRRLIISGVAPAQAARIARDHTPEVPKISEKPEAPDPGTDLQAIRLRRAALALDVAALDRYVRLALADGVVPAWTGAFAPALREVGRRSVTLSRYIAAEHLLSAAISAALAAVPRPLARPTILLACAPAELHCLPLEALAAALAERRQASRMLGPRVPANVLRDAITRTGPAAVVLWAHAPGTADPVQLAAASTARPRPPLVAVCGPGWAPETLPPDVRLLPDLPGALAVITAPGITQSVR